MSNKSSSVMYCARCAAKLDVATLAPYFLTSLFTKSPSEAHANPRLFASGNMGGKHTPFSSLLPALTACDAPCAKNHSSSCNHPLSATPVVLPASNFDAGCAVDSTP